MMGAKLKPADYLGEKTCSQYAYISIKYEGYTVYPFSSNPTSSETAIVGVQDNHILRSIEFIDAVEAYKQDREGAGSLLPTRGTPIRPQQARSIWADAYGVSIHREELHDRSILIKMLTLCAQHETTLFFEENSDAAKDVILTICEQYGLPTYTDDKNPASLPTIDWFAQPIFANAPEKWLHYGFFVSRFLIELRHLYCFYLLWCGFLYDDGDALSTFDELTEGVYHFNESGPLNAFLEEVTIENKVSRVLEFSGKRMVITLVSHSLFDALSQQMIDLFALGKDGADGKSLHACERCGEPFIRKHKNAKLCAQCRTNAEVLRAYRARRKNEKEASSNAEKSE